MGGGSYSVTDRATRATASGFHSKSRHEIFTSTSLKNEMNPKDVKVRESRDSDEHPNSLGVILGLDVTGSMGDVPHHLVKEGLPHIVGNVIQAGEKDPQVLFLGIGDHECDRAPLQVGQFESSDELLDKWLTDVYLEGGGGGNAGESYLLAWYFAAYHTAMDCWEKRKRKGYLFTIGDEPVLRALPAGTQKNLMGTGQYSDQTAASLLAEAQKTFNVFHVHIGETGAGRRQSTVDDWKQLLQDNVLVVQKHEDVSKTIVQAILKDGQQTAPAPTAEATPAPEGSPKPDEVML